MKCQDFYRFPIQKQYLTEGLEYFWCEAMRVVIGDQKYQTELTG